MRGLPDSGVPAEHPALQCAASRLIRKEIRQKGDWAVFRLQFEPSGWAYEFENIHYPDIDDTSIIVFDLAADTMGYESRNRARNAAIGCAANWSTGMQCSNGGWAAFDWNNDSRRLANIPFADFGKLLNPPSVDVTAHVLEMCGRPGYPLEYPAVSRGLAFIWGQQDHEGRWFGRWGINYLYGTAAVLPGLEASGVGMSLPRVRRAVEWLVARQKPDGWWGETCASYVNPALRRQGRSTPSQTYWALIALIGAGYASHDAVARGIDFLIELQRADGTWDEPQFTGRGFSGYGHGDRLENFEPADGADGQGPELGAAVMINYHFCRNCFPLWALGRYEQAMMRPQYSTTEGAPFLCGASLRPLKH